MTVLPSGKTQQTHIIQAIGILAGAPNVSVRSATAKTKTFELMGINPAEFVGTTIGNEKKARNPCDLAFNRNAEKLKKAGFVQSGGRGKYALTPLGFARFQTITPTGETVAQAPEAQAAPNVPTAPVATKPAVQAQSVHKVAVMAGGIQLATPTVLREDAHLLNMQKSNSPCFGIGFTSNSKVCGRCPIAGMCQRKRMGGLANLASLVKQGVADGNLGVVLGLVAPPAIEEEPEAAPEPVATPSDHTIEALPIEIDGIECEHCKTPIAKGSQGYIIAHVGLVHEHCVNSALATAKGGA